MNQPSQKNPSQAQQHAPPAHRHASVRRAALFASAFLSGCGAGAAIPAPAAEALVSISSSSEIVLPGSGAVPRGDFRTLLRTLRGRAGQYTIELSGEEGTIGDWAFRRTDHSERGGFSFYDLFLTSQLIVPGQPDRVELLYSGRIASPYRNIPVEHSPGVGSDVFVVGIPGRVIFDFRDPATGMPAKRHIEFDGAEVGPDPTLVADYDASLNRVLVYFISDSTITAIVFNLRSAEISMRRVSPE